MHSRSRRAPFEIHDDSETLKRMNMQICAPDDLPHLVPEGLAPLARELLAAPDAALSPGPHLANGSRK